MEEIRSFNDFFDMFHTILFILYISFTKHKLTFSCLCIDKKRMCPYFKPLILELIKLIGLLLVQFVGNRARNKILKCEVTGPITPITITNSWIIPVA